MRLIARREDIVMNGFRKGRTTSANGLAPSKTGRTAQGLSSPLRGVRYSTRGVTSRKSLVEWMKKSSDMDVWNYWMDRSNQCWDFSADESGDTGG